MDNNFQDIDPVEKQPGSLPQENTVPLRSEYLDDSEDTSKINVQKTKKPGKSKKGKSGRRWLWVLAGLTIFFILIAIGAFIGYQTGINARLKNQSEQVAMIAATQFQLGLEEMNAGRLEVARKRFEYVVQLDPKFPGAAEKLTETMMKIAQTTAPTAIIPTMEPTLTPTPDMRGEEEIFNHATQLLRSQDWQNTIVTLDGLRNRNMTYRAVEVDGMYYVALRQRGVQKILSGDLEPGIYDLALSERFGPMDKEANGFRNFARTYILGSSFWEIDWAEVINYFGQVYAGMPNLRDGSDWTAAERYRVGLIHYADELAAKEDWCGARDHYNMAFAIANDPQVAPTATAVQLICSPPTAVPTMTPTAPLITETPIIIETAVPTEATTEAPTETEAPPPDYIGLCCPVQPGQEQFCADNAALYVCPAP